MNVLIVEDEIGLAKEINSFLSNEGFKCESVCTGKDASEKIFVNEYDFVLLDLGLPDYEGIDLLKEARKEKKDASFIILTARSGVNDKIMGLNLGADDYLAKPFSLPELLSRMYAIKRRKHGLQSNTIRVHEFEIDMENRIVTCKKDELKLTKKEFEIFHYLALNRNRVLTRMQITEHIWGDILEDDTDSNYVDVHVKNLRKKLSDYSDLEWFLTVRGIGYKIISE